MRGPAPETLTPPDLAHARHVADLSLALFDYTRRLHRLSLSLRPSLETAALLHHAASSEIELSGYTVPQKRVIACLIHAHHKKGRLEADELFTTLPPARQRQTLALSALLRLADGLDDSHTQSTQLDGVVITPEAARLRLSGPEARRDAAHARKKARLWGKVFHVALETVLVPYPAQELGPASTWPLGPQTPMSEFARRALAVQLHEWQAGEAAALAGEPQALQAVHQSISRMGSALRLFKSCFPPKPARRLRRRVREAERRLERVQELEGLLADAKDYQAEHARAAGLRPLIAAWGEQRLEALTDLKAWLGGPAADLQNAVTELIGLSPKHDEASLPFEQGAAQVLQAAVAEVRERQAAVERDQPKTYQRLGRALARCRYALEFFRPAFGSASNDAFEEVMHDLARFQSRLAQVRAARLLQKRIEAFLDEWAEHQGKRKAPQLAGVEGVLEYSLARKGDGVRQLRTLNPEWAPVRAARLGGRVKRLLGALKRVAD